ncbi:hypothetical protein F511_06423 [Dorcoceras hygrometricum]|uniref:Uncharacterized protein n=1 Tax=Dorcoceras hygrometricum TaxID=472368 RepID=A0A2Z7B3S7_9LAMI|nr:hypothetical protein F511_06423 [Dorcoceras hygrometricum]
MVKRLATSPYDPLGITDSACKNQSVMVGIQYGPFNSNIPIRATTIGKSGFARDPITMHTSWKSNSDIARVTRLQKGDVSKSLQASRKLPKAIPIDASQQEESNATTLTSVGAVYGQQSVKIMLGKSVADPDPTSRGAAAAVDRQSGPRPDSIFLQSACTRKLMDFARTETPLHDGRNKSDEGRHMVAERRRERQKPAKEKDASTFTLQRSVAPKWKEDKIAFWSAEEFWKLSNGKNFTEAIYWRRRPLKKCAVTINVF